MPDTETCTYRKGFGENYWRCPKLPESWFWNINNLSGMCLEHEPEIIRMLKPFGTVESMSTHQKLYL